MGRNLTRLKFMHPTDVQRDHERSIQSKLLEFRTGIKQNAIKKKVGIKQNAIKKKVAKPISESIKEIQKISDSFNAKRSV